MPDLARFQQQFADAILAEGSVGGRFADPAFAIYRNGPRKAAAEALTATYPTVAALVGEGAFAALAADHFALRPPRSPILSRYGAGFDRTVVASPLDAQVPYLADMARLEWAIARVRFARDEAPIGFDHLIGIDPAQVERARFRLIDAAALEHFEHPVATIWNAHREAGGPAGLSPEWRAEKVLIVRRGTRIVSEALDAGVFDFFSALAAGEMLGAAVVDPVAARPAADIAALVRRFAQSGAFAPITEETIDAK